MHLNVEDCVYRAHQLVMSNTPDRIRVDVMQYMLSETDIAWAERKS